MFMYYYQQQSAFKFINVDVDAVCRNMFCLSWFSDDNNDHQFTSNLDLGWRQRLHSHLHKHTYCTYLTMGIIHQEPNHVRKKGLLLHRNIKLIFACHVWMMQCRWDWGQLEVINVISLGLLVIKLINKTIKGLNPQTVYPWPSSRHVSTQNHKTITLIDLPISLLNNIAFRKGIQVVQRF